MTNTIINNINADIISKANEANKAETERISLTPISKCGVTEIAL